MPIAGGGLEDIGFKGEWVQMNHSFTAERATIRGMHYQNAPFSEIKLVRCIRGRVFDVVIDLRRNSSTFLNWFGLELSPDIGNMLFIPKGFAHGFQALDSDCELLYHHSAYYEPRAETGIRFDDPCININWPLPVGLISERDLSHPLLTNEFKGMSYEM